MRLQRRHTGCRRQPPPQTSELIDLRYLKPPSHLPSANFNTSPGNNRGKPFTMGLSRAKALRYSVHHRVWHPVRRFYRGLRRAANSPKLPTRRRTEMRHRRLLPSSTDICARRCAVIFARLPVPLAASAEKTDANCRWFLTPWGETATGSHLPPRLDASVTSPEAGRCPRTCRLRRVGPNWVWPERLAFGTRPPGQSGGWFNPIPKNRMRFGRLPGYWVSSSLIRSSVAASSSNSTVPSAWAMHAPPW